MRIFIPIALFALTSACSYGPKTKDKTFLESMNGAHYETSATGIAGTSTPGLPIAHRHRAPVRISGKLLLKQDPIPVPLANQRMVLLQESKPIATARSEAGGSFAFVGDFEDGTAVIQIDSPKYKGDMSLLIKGFAMENLEFVVTSK